MQPAPRSTSSSTRPGASPLPRQPQVQQVNTQTKILDTVAGRILCIADIRGRISAFNDLAREANAKAIIHTGDFGFFESNSLERINDRTLRHLTQYSPLIPQAQRNALLAPENPAVSIRSTMSISNLSEFPLLLSGQLKLDVPVFAVWGACEDVVVLEKFRMGTYDIENLHVLDEATTRCLDVGGIKLRLLGLGGAFVPHKLFDNGDGNATIAGGQGTMWITTLQLGELLDTAQRVYDPTETRLLVTHASPGREGIIAQLALAVKADLTISAGLHFRYASSYNEFSVQGDFDGFRRKLLTGKELFDKIWESVKTQVEQVIDENQRILLDKALSIIEKVPQAQANTGPSSTATGEEPSWKNCWNWNLCDAAYGSLVLEVKDGRISAELKSQGFNYAYRRSVTPSTTALTPNSVTSALPSNAAPSNSATPAPGAVPQHVNANNAISKTPTPPPNAPRSGAVSGKVTPKEPVPPKVNGVPPTHVNDKTDNKDKQKKDKRRDKKERSDATEKDSNSPEAASSINSKPSQSAGINQTSKQTAIEEKPDADTTPLSPATAGTDSPGIRTPTSRRPNRNPWTIFLRFSVSANESDLRFFFGEAKDGITRINIPPIFKGPKIAYVEFGDEEAMKAGLEKHEEKLNGIVPYVVQAEERENRESREHSGGFRGRGRGGRGGFASRGLASAGLTRAPTERKPHSDGNNASKETSESKKEG